MKRFALTLILTCFCSMSAMAAMSHSKIRTYARFLSDRMAYELDLTPMQYDDCYEINYDFLTYINPLLNDMIYGYYDAIEEYYTYLDYRNDDFRYILSRTQYIKFMERDYFYRPIYSTGRDWALRVYTIYSNRNFYYYDAPLVYKTYKGLHSRHYNKTSYYSTRYSTIEHHTNITIRNSSTYDSHRRSDFGVNIKKRDGNKYDINNYKNENQNDREHDHRYIDKSNNKNSPEINKRNDNNSRTNKTTDDRTRKSVTTNNSQTQESVKSGRGNSSTDNSSRTSNANSSNTRSSATTTRK